MELKMVTVTWPSFTRSQVEDCFDAWYEDLFDREFDYAGFQGLHGDEYNNTVTKDLAKYNTTVKHSRAYFEITFENDADYTFFLLKWG
jgi:hypothetical protein